MIIKTYRKKPVEIQAIQFVEDSLPEVLTWIGDKGKFFTNYEDAWFLEIQTLEGTMCAHIGDYIIRGIKGEFYPCKPDIFKATYEEVGS